MNENNGKALKVHEKEQRLLKINEKRAAGADKSMNMMKLAKHSMKVHENDRKPMQWISWMPG